MNQTLKKVIEGHKMNKISYMLKEMCHLIVKYKYYFLAPLLLTVVLLAVLSFYVGPAVIVSFIYAGI